MATLKWPSISERRSPTESATNRVDLDRTGMPVNGLSEFTIRILNNWATHSRATSLGTEMATLKWPSIRQWPDRTYDPNSQKLDGTKSGLHLCVSDGTKGHKTAASSCSGGYNDSATSCTMPRALIAAAPWARHLTVLE